MSNMYKLKIMCAKLNKKGDYMLKIVTEFSKGILFVRLYGTLNKNSVPMLNEEVTFLVKNNGFKNIVFNIEYLDEIDIKGAYAILYNYEIVRKNKGNVYICGTNNEKITSKLKKLKIFNYIKKKKNELEILKKERVI